MEYERFKMEHKRFFKNLNNISICQILYYTKKVLLKNSFSLFLANLIFFFPCSKIYPVVHLNTSKAPTLLVSKEKFISFR